MRTLTIALALTALFAGAGCSHHAGWVDKETRRVALTRETRDTTVSAKAPIRVLSQPTAASGALHLRLVRIRLSQRMARRDLTGRRTYVRYHWSVPLLKPFVMISVYFPFYLPNVHPHNHSGGTWGAGDYFRDVLAWYNIFEAYPNGPQEVEETRKTISSRLSWVTVQRREIPLVGARVEVRADGKALARARSDNDGVAKLDLRPHLTPAMASTGQRFEVVLLAGRIHAGAKRQVTVDRGVIQALLQAPR